MAYIHILIPLDLKAMKSPVPRKAAAANSLQKHSRFYDHEEEKELESAGRAAMEMTNQELRMKVFQEYWGALHEREAAAKRQAFLVQGKASVDDSSARLTSAPGSPAAGMRRLSSAASQSQNQNRNVASRGGSRKSARGRTFKDSSEGLGATQLASVTQDTSGNRNVSSEAIGSFNQSDNLGVSSNLSYERRVRRKSFSYYLITW
jgi:hypothetical protein